MHAHVRPAFPTCVRLYLIHVVWIDVVVLYHLRDLSVPFSGLSGVVELCVPSSVKTSEHLSSMQETLTITMRIWGVPHRPDRLIVQSRQMIYPPRELFGRFIRLVHVPRDSGLHVSSDMIDGSVNHTVFDGLSDDILCIFL